MANLYMLKPYVFKSIRRHETIDFVETGTYLADGFKRVCEAGFDIKNCYSCDIHESFVNDARNAWPGAYVEVSDSLSFLRKLLPKLERPTLFWLDAHFPGFYNLPCESEDIRAPILKELYLIKELKKAYEKDVIMFDDTHCLRHPDNPMYKEGKLDESLMVDIDWHELTSIFSDTHDMEHVLEMPGIPTFEGAIILTPKK